MHTLDGRRKLAALERATADGKRGLAHKLVGAGAEIGDALHHETVRGGHGKIVIDLLEIGASFNANDTKGSTPLLVAAGRGETEIVQLLLLKGAATNVFDYQESTALYLVPRQGHVVTSLALLTAGTGVGIRCGKFNSPVTHMVAEKGHVEILTAVIKHGADRRSRC